MGILWSSSGPKPVGDRDVMRHEEMEKFKEELRIKREARLEAIKSLQQKIKDLQDENERSRTEVEKLRLTLAESNGEKEIKELLIEDGDPDEDPEWKREEVEGLEKQIKALKDVASIGGEMLKIRELQVNELKSKLMAIEETGQAYEKEVENMRRLKTLYEERTRAVELSHKMELERERMKLVAAETKREIAEQQSATLEEKLKEVQDQVKNLDGLLDTERSQVSELKIQLAGKIDELYSATSQINIINQLFGHALSPRPDSLERVTKILEEHHDLVNQLTAAGKINDLASTLLELANKDHLPNNEEEDVTAHLGKVWRLLVELLGHHVKPGPTPHDSCYKSVDTPSGPKLVISVSQTFLRLKDLILEKNSLVTEVGRLKDLNSTLETRLTEQESRLVVVAAELHSTWGVVNKLKTQHKALHTHEKVLKYELAQKRLLLNELKKELENCKDNWALARAKNDKTEEDWRVLRSEFASRKAQISSAESGYEESPNDSQDEDDWKEKFLKKDASDDEDSWNKFEEPEPLKLLPWDDNGDEKETIAAKTIKEEPTCDIKDNNEIKIVTKRTTEEILEARQARLQRLEDQCKGLFNKMSQTSQRSDIISNRLGELHEMYGEDRNHSEPSTSGTSQIPIPPPLPAEDFLQPKHKPTDPKT